MRTMENVLLSRGGGRSSFIYDVYYIHMITNGHFFRPIWYILYYCSRRTWNRKNSKIELKLFLSKYPPRSGSTLRKGCLTWKRTPAGEGPKILLFGSWLESTCWYEVYYLLGAAVSRSGAAADTKQNFIPLLLLAAWQLRVYRHTPPWLPAAGGRVEIVRQDVRQDHVYGEDDAC